MYLGMERDPDWSRNLEANPDATIMSAGRHVEARARRTSGEDRQRLWPRCLEIQPVSRRFEPIAQREIPIFRLTPLSSQEEVISQSDGELSAGAAQASPEPMSGSRC